MTEQDLAFYGSILVPFAIMAAISVYKLWCALAAPEPTMRQRCIDPLYNGTSRPWQRW